MVDAGNALWKGSTLTEGEKRQQQRKAQLIADSFAVAGIDAMGVGEGEMAWGLPWLKEIAAKDSLPYLTANLDCGGSTPFPGWKVVEKGGAKIGIVGLVGNSVKAEGCMVTRPETALQAAFDAMGPVDLRVVLSTVAIEELSKALESTGGSLWVDVIVQGEGRKETKSAEALAGGGLWVGAGSRDKKLGLLNLSLSGDGHKWRDSGALSEVAARKDTVTTRIQEAKQRKDASTDEKEQKRLETRIGFYEKELLQINTELETLTGVNGAREARNAFMELGTDIADHAETAALVAAAKADVDAMVMIKPAVKLNGPFVGAAACVTCHPAEASSWSITAHATAYNSLQSSNRTKDPSCFACHVTGAQHPDGPHDVMSVGGLENVGCEACHGPGRDHAAMPAQVKPIRTPPLSTCTNCHDGAQDGGRFDEATYWAKIVHTLPNVDPTMGPATPP